MSIKTILVGVDDSAGSLAALRWAAELALALDARVVLAHVFEPLAHLADLAPGVDLRTLRDRASAAVRGPLSDELRSRHLVHEVVVREGQPAEVLAAVAEEIAADLLVVGARRMGRVKGLLLGSTSSRLSQLTPRPTVVIHG